ncbi:geranylgeranylglyceryl/heptaprenylglyceryl phosphate synthase [Flavobacterium sp. NRK F10]|uniref:geranylgeranylglyceryl/heptaprenylglyceryl phosphate synthase n=1 Tax=Flavobacterium sp. NRK F10 TaxID=2954931 RepID=UPI002091ADA8|nr:geranylgeranylglyceryl/heptaprenylglyceryl phosphate synthase [Flavobacterium sp. NRK F10]MCO6175089.1 geranylgeranylglyceryl/heptaprenylglyceryl phosphate synthase [Flavobacterium sp. NRK F10]
MSIYQNIIQSAEENKKLLAILIDPEKIALEHVPHLISQIKKSPATHILVGGSTFDGQNLDDLISGLKKHCDLPVLLFPGGFQQISAQADGILFLSLLSGRNPDYLIEHQVRSVPYLEQTRLEVIPTGYLLIESGKETAVARVSQTLPLSRENIEYVSQTAKAGEYLGKKLIYLEAGSGAKHAVPIEMIRRVKDALNIPLIVGGGIRSKNAIEEVFNAGADMVVIGTAFENDNTFFDV